MKISGTITEARFDDDGRLVLTVQETHEYRLDAGAYAPIAASYGNDPAQWPGRSVVLNLPGIDSIAPRGFGFGFLPT